MTVRVDINKEYTQKTDSSAILLKFFKHLFSLENRVRVLEGKVQITKRQYIDWLKSQ